MPSLWGRGCFAGVVLWVASFLPFSGPLGAQTVVPPLPGPDVPANSEAGDGASDGKESPQAPAVAQPADPPSRVVRVSVVNGSVSAEPSSVNVFTPAEVNQVLTTGDRVYTDPSAEAELESTQLAVRLGGGTDLTVTAMTDTLAQFALATGSIHLRSAAIDPGTVLELDSPQAAITVLQPGDLRVDVDPAAHTTTIALDAGQVQVDGPGSSQVLTAGQRVRIHGGDPETGEQAFAEPVSGGEPDGLDSFSATRDSQGASGSDAASPYVNPGTVGQADLADYGSWQNVDGENAEGGESEGFSAFSGPVWFPAVAVEWHPYGQGHWRYVSPWGWTWVGAEPWGFAPFHYGRWGRFGGRWGWIPGPRVVRPVYAPALVAFAGGAQFSQSLGFAPGLGITAWFPLGPREPYSPPYHGSTRYLNRVNASNLYNPNTAEVRAFYNQRAVNVFAGTPGAPHTYVNRLAATTAIPQSSFAAGRSVGNATLRIPAEALLGAPVLAHPAGQPERSAYAGAFVGSGAAVALPPVLARPVVAGPSRLAVGRGGDAGGARYSGVVEGTRFPHAGATPLVRGGPAPAPAHAPVPPPRSVPAAPDAHK